jgi:regulator of sigma E protease
VGKVTIGSIARGAAAEKAGLQRGDLLRTIDGKPIATFNDLLSAVRDSGGKELEVSVERAKPLSADMPAAGPAPVEVLSVKVKPVPNEKEVDFIEGRNSGQPTYRIGVGMPLAYEPIGLGEALYTGGQHVVGMTYMTLRIFKALLTGQLSASKTIGGPLSIIQQTAQSTEDGFSHVLEMMILLNVSLGVMNLLPVPVLDGGHLTLFTLELLKGGRLSFRFQEVATRVGMAMLLLLMVFAFGNDILRLSSWK